MSSVNLKRQQKINAQMGEVMDDFDRFEYTFATHWKKVVIIAVLIVLGVAVYVTIGHLRDKKAAEAAAAFAKASDVAAIEALIEKYGTASAAVRMRLASLYFDAKDYDKASNQLQLIADNDDTPELQWRARINLAYILEKQGKYAEAADMLADFARSTNESGSFGYAIEAFSAAGRNYLLANKITEAGTILAEGRNAYKNASDQDKMMYQDYSAVIANMIANMPADK